MKIKLSVTVFRWRSGFDGHNNNNHRIDCEQMNVARTQWEIGEAECFAFTFSLSLRQIRSTLGQAHSGNPLACNGKRRCSMCCDIRAQCGMVSTPQLHTMCSNFAPLVVISARPIPSASSGLGNVVLVISRRSVRRSTGSRAERAEEPLPEAGREAHAAT